MAFKKLNTQLSAISIGPKKGEAKTVEGYIVGARYGIGKNKKNKGSTLYQMKDGKGERFDIWGSAVINGALCKPDGRFDPQHGNKLVRIQFVKMGVAKNGQSAPKLIDVFIDDSKTLKLAK